MTNASCWRPYLLLVPILAAVVWVGANGYQGLNGQDAHDYLRIARAWSAWLHGGVRPVMAEHPHGYPILGMLIGRLFGDDLVGLRIMSAVGLVALMFTLRAFLRRSFPIHPSADVFVLLAFGMSPFLLRYAVVVMSDVPGIVLVLLTYVYVVSWIQEGGRRWLLLAVLSAAAALSIRLAVAPVLWALFLVVVHGYPKGRALRWSVVGVLLLTGLAIVLFRLPQGGMNELLARSPLAEWSPWNFFRRILHSDDGTLVYDFPNLLYVLGVFVHPGFLPMGVFVWPFFRRADLSLRSVQVALWSLGCYLLFIAGMPFQNDRVLLMALPFAVIVLYPAFTRARDFVVSRGWRPIWFILPLALLQFGLFLRAIQPFMDQARTERELAAVVNELHPKRIYTHGMGAALTNYCAQVPVTELWYSEVDHFDPQAILVLRPENLHEQWTGLPPALNWRQAQKQGVDAVLVRADGWLIARVR